MRQTLALLLLASAWCCSKPAPQPPPRAAGRVRPLMQPPPDDRAEQQSLASVARGANVVDRTGELILENSAIRLIDGDPLTSWMPPPRDLPQTITIALAARTRISRIGIRTDEDLPAKHVVVESSIDGKTFTPLATMTAAAKLDPQWFDVTPVEATQIRMTATDRVAPDREIRIHSLLVGGTEIDEPRPGDIAGCWAVNEMTGRFDRRGAAVTGILTTKRAPFELDGGFDGRIYRFNWLRGNDYGYALVTISPGGKALNALEWHEEAIPLFSSDSWFGAHAGCGPPNASKDLRERYLRRAGRYSLFGIRFRDDASIDREASTDTLGWLARFCRDNPVQLVAHEFRKGSPADNRAFAQREIEALLAELKRAGVTNVTFVAAGSDSPRQVPQSDAAREMYSTVDVEIRR